MSAASPTDSPPASGASHAVSPALASRREVAFATMAAFFCVVLVLTNIIGVKLFELFPDGRPAWMPGSGPLTLTSGILTYPITFLLTDVVSEIWGRRRAGAMVVMGFFTSLLMLGIVALARALPISPFWSLPAEAMGGEPLDAAALQHAFEATFFFPGLLLFASMLAYLVAQLLDVRLYHFWWKLTGGGHMWVRNNGSTMLSQLVDTIIVVSIYLRFGLEQEWSTIGSVILAVYLCKVLLAVVDTPLIYLSRGLLYRYLELGTAGRAGRAPLEAA